MFTKIKDIKSFDGQKVTLRGFVSQVRDLKKMQFIILRDITGTVQVTVFKNGQCDELNQIISKLTVESSITVTGTVQVSEYVKLNGVEILAESIEVINLANNFMPIDMTNHDESNNDIRMDWRFLDLRTRAHQLIFKVQTTAEMAMRKFWVDRDFIEIHSPKIMGNPSESGAELFELDYFGRKAYLAQSPQFYKQMGIAAGFEKVFEIGPVFRADKSNTNRHTTEFTGVDCEFAWIDGVEDIMKLEEEWIAYFMQAVKDKHGEEIKEVFGKEVIVPTVPFPRLTMEQAKEVIKGYNYEVPASTKGDLDPTAEKLLGKYAKEKFGSDFIFITEFPTSVRPFYHMRKADNPDVTLSFDLMMNGLEITTGSQREHRYDILCKQAVEKGLSLDNLKSYLDYFDYGCPPHGGFGFGLARMLMNLLGYPNIREVSFLYRSVDRLFP